ncbi:hypothetical protein DSM110093_03646 (plasmid) [Sulfitobacter sp. DSM 110093]|uniref:DUF6958 family protein n=1 Tax=Sulfitobacter sp. DSM 110093 TaxID=2883127 RepID=UPI001FAD0D85|nr:hypothetical protein [Sulfitobacter sp. DSM 110093]UOA33811.1 hypothetical protein DSM110093_03646 [Sulfitobacter sp. DSM 110093]
MSDADQKIEIESITSPHHVRRVDKVKFTAICDALLPVLPTEAPGMSVAEAKAALLSNLSQELFPGGEKAGWWLKAVQLDLEAKGVIERSGKGPVRLFRTGKST